MVELLKRVGWYTFSTIYAVSLQTILTIILITQLSLEDYGLVGFFLGVIAILSVIISLGSENAVARSVHENKVINNDSVVQASIFIVSLNTFILFFIIFTTSVFIEIKFKLTILAIFAAAMQACMTILQVQLQMRDMAKKFAFVSIFYNSAIFIFTLSTLHTLSFYSRILAPSLAGFFVIAVYCLIFKGAFLKLPSSNGNFSYIRKVGFPLTPHALLGVLNGYGDRLILGLAGNPTLLGAYSIISQILNIQTTAISTLNNAYLPWLFNKINKSDSIKWHVFCLTALFFGLLISCSIFLITNKLSINETYIDVFEVAKFIGLCFFLDAIYYILVGKLYFFKKSFEISLTTSLQMLFRVVAGILYVTIFSPTLLGMIILYIVGAAIRLVITYYYFKKY